MNKTLEILDLTNDIVFKTVFSNENFKWYLSDIISYFLKVDTSEIYNHLKYKSNFIPNINLKGKTGEGDILVEVKNNLINLEMNREVTETLLRKNKKYVSALDSMNTEKIKKGKFKDKYIIQINISTKARIPKTNELLYEIIQMDRNLKVEDQYNNYIIYDLNLEYLKKELYNKGKIKKEEKRFLPFIERDMEKLKEMYEGDENMEKTVEDLDSLIYFEEFEKLSAQFNTEEFKELIHKEAIEDAKKEAREDGLSEGLSKGISTGAQQEKQEIAKNLISMGMEDKDIIKATNLSPKVLKKIQKELEKEKN